MKEPPDPDENNTSKFTIVKSTLNQFCNNNFIKQKLNQHVLNSNKLIFEVYKFANLHLLRCFRDNEVLPVLDQHFLTHTDTSTLHNVTHYVKICRFGTLPTTN